MLASYALADDRLCKSFLILFNMHDVYFMQIALEEARQAAEEGEAPIGALLVYEGKILARAHNIRESSRNPLDHAELRLLQEIGQKTGNWRLTGTTLYVTLEPCPMCLGALLQARVGRLVFGCGDPKREGDDYFPSLSQRVDESSGQQILKSNNHTLSITGGILKEECSQLLKDFFKQCREKPELTVSVQGGTCDFPNDF